jgi:hypothetical protein
MKKQIFTFIGMNEIILSSPDVSDVYSVKMNPNTSKFYISSDQGINTAGIKEYASLEAAIKEAKTAIQNND